MSIIDRRSVTNKNKSVVNRQKFIKRYKQKIKDSIDNIANDKGITDILNNKKVKVKANSTDEPSFNFDYSKGNHEHVYPGNKTMRKGDEIQNPEDDEGEAGSRGGPCDAELFDEFTFTLTKDEFLDLYFSDMALPKFIKEQLNKSVKYKLKRAGYVKEGVPSRLDLLKTLKQSLARRIATGSTRYLEEIDMRFKHFTKQKLPVRQAVMICLMDVSGSMDDYKKTIAKKFFLLLYLFLHKSYPKVEVIFIRHTENAKEVTEDEFFHSRESGGTIVSAGLELTKDIIKRYDLGTTNIYVAQASDGDNWPEDESPCLDAMSQILPAVQYYAYIQTESPSSHKYKMKNGIEDLYTLYSKISDKYRNFKTSRIFQPEDVFPVLQDLFKKEED